MTKAIRQMASEIMMSECAERIISEDYADFIIEIGFRKCEARQEYKDLCIQDIGYKFSTTYYPLSEINPICGEIHICNSQTFWTYGYVCSRSNGSIATAKSKRHIFNRKWCNSWFYRYRN